MMPSKQQQTSGSLRAMIAQAVQAYELAKATRLQIERQAQQERDKHRQQLEGNHKREEKLLSAEQERIGSISAAIEQAEQAARDLLDKAGLAYIAGAPLDLTDVVAPIRRGDEAVTAAFAAAQIASVDLRVALLSLGQQYLESQCWEEARYAARPLLEDRKAPLYSDARDLLCESHYRPATAALKVQKWEEARRGFQAVLAEAPVYRAAATLYRETYLSPANLALEVGRWEEARQHAEAWLSSHKDDSGAQQVVRESYLRAAGQALEAKRWEEVRQHAESWLKRDKKDAEARDLVCESLYQQALAAAQAGEWQAAYQAFAAVVKLEASYRDAVDQQRQVIHHWLDLDLVKIPAGTFLYGNSKQPTHLEQFWISRTPVTNAQYQVFVKATGLAAPSHWSGGQVTAGKEQHPVLNVSWNDAQAFCRWAGVSLPWERQWEKAARGTDGRSYPWGEAAPDEKRCNFGNRVAATTAVGAYPEGASPYGVLDMAGNVWEWCEDAHDSSSRVLRGGAFRDNESNMRCAARHYHALDNQFGVIGFRVCVASQQD